MNYFLIAIISIFLIAIIYYLYSKCQRYNNFNKDFDNQTLLTEHFNDIVKKHEASEIYDKFYAEIYDQLFLSDLKNEYECIQIQKNYLREWKGPPIKILDVGCGTGHHLKILKRYGHHMEGLDQSAYMLKKAKRQCPEAILRKGNLDQSNMYESRRFTHILCLFFTIYYSKNINKAFQNFNKWLQPNGYLFVHVVVRDKFDPVLERSSSLIPLFDPQRHSKTRVTRTVLKFKEFSYESDWDLSSKKSRFQEVIRFKKKPYDRQHIHTFYLTNLKSIIKRANNNGFVLEKEIDLFLVGHGHNYILCFRKMYGK